MDASQEQSDIVSFAVLEPKADGFCNYLKAKYAPAQPGVFVAQRVWA
jgi:catalase (peroxidase I)